MTDGPSLDPDTMFEDVYAKLPPHLVRQRDEMRALRAAHAEPAPGETQALDSQAQRVTKEG
jgi:hypothetical protein